MTRAHIAAASLWVSATILLMRPGQSEAQEVIFVHGSGFWPSDVVSEGGVIPPGTTVEADRTTFVVLGFSWQSDNVRFKCEKWVIITNGLYTVGDVNETTPGRCDTSDAATAENAFGAGGPVRKVTFYGDASADDPRPVPEKIRRSQEVSAILDRRRDDLKQTPVPGEQVTPGVPAAHGGSRSGNLTGTWSSNSGGAYYIRQISNRVWWVGMSADDGRSWTHVFVGAMRNDSIFGGWADTPRGATSNAGRITLVMTGSGRLRAIERTGGFGDSEWRRVRTTRP